MSDELIFTCGDEGMTISDVDEDGHVEFTITDFRRLKDTYSFIESDDARQIIEFLNKEFDLEMLHDRRTRSAY